MFQIIEQSDLYRDIKVGHTKEEIQGPIISQEDQRF